MKLRYFYFGNKSYGPLPPPMALPLTQAKLKLYWNQSFCQNKHTICGHLVIPSILVPLFSFPKVYDSSIFRTPTCQRKWKPLQQWKVKTKHFLSLFLIYHIFSLSKNGLAILLTTPLRQPDGIVHTFETVGFSMKPFIWISHHSNQGLRDYTTKYKCYCFISPT